MQELSENQPIPENQPFIYQGFQLVVENLKSVARKGVPVRVRPVALLLDLKKIGWEARRLRHEKTAHQKADGRFVFQLGAE